jgi:hypothetical protein
MAIRIELNLRLPNSPGALAAVCRLLSDEHVNIDALSVDSSGRLRLVVDNHVRAKGILRDQHHQVAERNVVMAAVGHDAGGLAPVLQLAADAGINLEYAYGSAASDTPTASIVLGVDDALRAAAAAGI